MKNIKLLALALATFVAGCFVGPHVVRAQSPSPAYTCDFGPSGSTSAYPCSQYLVAVSPQRLGGGVMIWQVTDTPISVNGASNLAAVGSGALAGTSVQLYLPGSSTQTFTLSETRP